jgi:hypothetical protein
MTEGPTIEMAPRCTFSATGMVETPERPGVYELFRGDDLLVIGGSTNLRADLEAHLRGERGSRTRCATHYKVEEMNASEVVDRQSELLGTYRRSRNSNVPVGNRSDVSDPAQTEQTS